MRKTVFIVFITLLIGIYGCSQKVETSQTSSEKPYSGESTTVDVIIKDFSYNPSEITIKRGTSVRWVQKDFVRHTVTSDEGIFDSALLSSSQTFTYTFDKPGTFSYHCIPHPYMRGKVLVE